MALYTFFPVIYKTGKNNIAKSDSFDADSHCKCHNSRTVNDRHLANENTLIFSLDTASITCFQKSKISQLL